MVLDTALTCCWQRLNTSFDMPKGVLYTLISSPAAYATPEAAMLSQLLAGMVQHQLNEVAYDAELAGMPLCCLESDLSFLHCCSHGTAVGFRVQDLGSGADASIGAALPGGRVVVKLPASICHLSPT